MVLRQMFTGGVSTQIMVVKKKTTRVEAVVLDEQELLKLLGKIRCLFLIVTCTMKSPVFSLSLKQEKTILHHFKPTYYSSTNKVKKIKNGK